MSKHFKQYIYVFEILTPYSQMQLVMWTYVHRKMHALGWLKWR
jgi:hypothetical protein